MALQREQQDLVDLIRLNLDRTDGVFDRFWRDLDTIFAREPAGPMTSFRRKLIMKDVDALIARYYGRTVEGALSSELFRTMLANTDTAAALPFRRTIERTKAVIDRRDPTFWANKIAPKASATSKDPFLRTIGELNGPATDRQRLLRAGKLDPQRRWVPKERHNTATGYRLSDRIWKQGRDTRTAIDQRLREGIARGEDALSIARDLEKHLNPEFASQKVLKDGRVVRRKNVTKFPGRGGYGNWPARRLAITETSRVHAAATEASGRVTPGAKGLKWLLSNNHKDSDQCNTNASQHSAGMEAGEYTFGEFPRMPDHPVCRCCSAVVLVSRDEMVADLVKLYGGE